VEGMRFYDKGQACFAARNKNGKNQSSELN